MKKKIEGKTFNSFVMLFLLLNKYSFVLLDIFFGRWKRYRSFRPIHLQNK